MASSKKKVLFIDRDGTLIVEPPVTEQVDTLEQLEFLPGVIRNLHQISQKLDFELVMVTNQDGLGTERYPQENFDTVQRKMLNIFKNEGVEFDKIFIDKSYPEDNLPTRKPGTAMLNGFFSDKYDLANSFVLGDRLTDIELAQNLGCKAIFINEISTGKLAEFVALQTQDWDEIGEYLFSL